MVELNNNAFVKFQMYPEHEMRDCECIGRSFFSLIEYLCPKFWYLFPKGTVKLLITQNFSLYTSNFWTNKSVDSMEVQLRDMGYQIQSNLIYKVVV